MNSFIIGLILHLLHLRIYSSLTLDEFDRNGERNEPQKYLCAKRSHVCPMATVPNVFCIQQGSSKWPEIDTS